jgi:hypothetical protein
VARDLAHDRDRRVRRGRAAAATMMVRRVIRRVSTGDALRRLPCERSAVRDRARQQARDAVAGRTRVLGQHVAAAGGN